MRKSSQQLQKQASITAVIAMLLAILAIAMLISGCTFQPRQPSAWQQHRLEQRRDALNKPIITHTPRTRHVIIW